MWLGRSFQLCFTKNDPDRSPPKLFLRSVRSLCLRWGHYTQYAPPIAHTYSNGSCINALNNTQRWGKFVVTSASWALACTYPSLADQKFLRMPRNYKLLQVILQYTTLLGSMTFLSMVSIIQALNPFSWVPTHLPQPSKVRFILDAFEDLIDWILKRHINSLSSLR